VTQDGRSIELTGSAEISSAAGDESTLLTVVDGSLVHEVEGDPLTLRISVSGG
jgi:hypothetical protein